MTGLWLEVIVRAAGHCQWAIKPNLRCESNLGPRLHPDSAVSRSTVDPWELFGLGGKRWSARTLTALR